MRLSNFFATATLLFISVSAQAFTKLGVAEKPFIGDDTSIKNEVLFFFNYNCEACFQFEPYLEAWEEKAPEGTSIKSVPIDVNESWEWATKLHFYAKKLNPELTRKDIYDTSFVQQYKVLSREDITAVLVETVRAPSRVIDRVIDKSDISTFLDKSNELKARFNVIGTPTLVLNVVGKGVYKIQPDETMTYPEMIQLTNGIIAFHQQ